MRNRYIATSFAALFAASLLTARNGAAQHGHGGDHSAGHSRGQAHAGPRAGGHPGGRILSGPRQSSIRHGVAARHDAWSVRPVHHAPRVRHGLHLGMGVGTRRYHAAQYAHGYSVYGPPTLVSDSDILTHMRMVTGTRMAEPVVPLTPRRRSPYEWRDRGL
jgi:hypothetical protein